MSEKKDSLFLSVNEGYNRWSEFYDADDIPLHNLEEAVVDLALGDVKGLSIVDLACGTGRQTLRLAGKGAVLTGVDQSEGMLAKARAKAGAEAVTFLHADLEKPFPFENEGFDRVVSFLALEHFSNLNFFFAESRRICRKDGFLYFTTMHPAMILKGVQARYTEKDGRKVYPKGYPHQTSDFVNAAVGAGLKFTAMTEHAPTEEDAKRSDRAGKYLGWPLLMTLTFAP